MAIERFSPLLSFRATAASPVEGERYALTNASMMITTRPPIATPQGVRAVAVCRGSSFRCANVGLLVISSRRVLRSAKLPSGGGHIERCAYDALDMFIEQNRDALQCNEIKMHKCSLQYATASRLSQLAPSATLTALSGIQSLLGAHLAPCKWNGSGARASSTRVVSRHDKTRARTSTARYTQWHLRQMRVTQGAVLGSGAFDRMKRLVSSCDSRPKASRQFVSLTILDDTRGARIRPSSNCASFQDRFPPQKEATEPMNPGMYASTRAATVDPSAPLA
eukprot:scaffold78639_cov30-Tisochrysis_lutea.AAC.1